jgi:hypothetical protein
VVEDSHRVAEDDLAGRSDGGEAGAGPALDQALAEKVFEGAYLLADRRLRVAEPLAAAGERAFLGDSPKGDQVPHLDARPGRDGFLSPRHGSHRRKTLAGWEG